MKYALCIAAVLLIVGGRLYHLLARPEWTEPQAMIGLWPVWLGAISLICIAFAFLQTEGDGI